MTARTGTAYLAARAARPHRRDPGARVPRRRLPGRSVRARRPRVRWPAAWSASATSCRPSCARSAAPTRRCRPGRVPARRLPRPRGAGRLPRAPRARGATTRTCAALLDAFLGDDGFRAELRRAPCTRAGHHAYLGGLLEHTVAVATLAQETCVLHPRLDSDLLISAAILHDVGKTREFELGAEIELERGGRGCSATWRSASSWSRSARRGSRLPAAEAARAAALHRGPPRRRRAAGPPLRLRRRRWRCTG